jgi:hypothetical protein
MCKSLFVIEVEQQRSRRERKKERDIMKQLHNHFGFHPLRSPISPTPPEVEIPTFDQRVRSMVNSGMINEYGSMFFQSGEASSSSAAPPPPPGTEEVPQPFGAPVGLAEFPPPFSSPVAPAPDATKDPEAPPNWARRFSTEIFRWSCYPPPYDGMDDDLHVLLSKLTIYEYPYHFTAMLFEGSIR